MQNGTPCGAYRFIQCLAQTDRLNANQVQPRWPQHNLLTACSSKFLAIIFTQLYCHGARTNTVGIQQSKQGHCVPGLLRIVQTSFRIGKHAIIEFQGTYSIDSLEIIHASSPKPQLVHNKIISSRVDDSLFSKLTV